MPSIQHKRGTRAALNTLASSSGLKPGEVYLISDEGRIAIATTASTYVAYAKESELSAGKLYYPSGSDVTIATSSFASGTTTFVPGTIRAWPWQIESPLTINQVRIEVTTLLAATSFRLGLYTDVNGVPGDLIANSDAGLFDASTTGVRTSPVFASNIVFPQPTWVWLAAHGNGAAVLRGIPPSNLSALLGYDSSGASTNRSFTCWSATQTFGAMPATFPSAGRAKTVNISAPCAMFRVP